MNKEYYYKIEDTEDDCGNFYLSATQPIKELLEFCNSFVYETRDLDDFEDLDNCCLQKELAQVMQKELGYNDKDKAYKDASEFVRQSFEQENEIDNESMYSMVMTTLDYFKIDYREIEFEIVEY